MSDKPDLVERRQKYIERQITLNKGDVNVRFSGLKPRGSGPSNRHGMPKLPVERAIDPDVLLVHSWEGRPLPHEHGGPVRMITPRLYAWKGAKWIRKIEFLAQDRKGFWEIRGYSNTAEPWFNDRYSTGG